MGGITDYPADGYAPISPVEPPSGGRGSSVSETTGPLRQLFLKLPAPITVMARPGTKGT